MTDRVLSREDACDCVFSQLSRAAGCGTVTLLDEQWQFVRCSDATWQLQVHVSSLPSALVPAELFHVKMSLQNDAFAATVLVPILPDTDFTRLGLTCEEIRRRQPGVVIPQSGTDWEEPTSLVGSSQTQGDGEVYLSLECSGPARRKHFVRVSSVSSLMRGLSRRRSLPRPGGCGFREAESPSFQLLGLLVACSMLMPWCRPSSSAGSTGACGPGWRPGGRAARRVPHKHYLTSCGTPRGRSATGGARPQLEHLALDRKFLLRGDSCRRVQETQRRQCGGSVVAGHRCLKVWDSDGNHTESTRGTIPVSRGASDGM